MRAAGIEGGMRAIGVKDGGMRAMETRGEDDVCWRVGRKQSM